MSILLYNAQIVSLSGIFAGSVLIEGDKISKVYRGDVEVIGEFDMEFDLEGKYLLPGMIDSHVHFRTPGHEYKEDWRTASAAAVAGGVTTVLDMPNNNPPAISVESLEKKRSIIRSRCNFGLYMGATPSNVEELKLAEGICGVKIYMGSSTGDLLVDKHTYLDEIFRNLPETLIAVHAENEERIKQRSEEFKGECDVHVHSKIRDCECAHVATKEAIHLGKKYGNRLHICHMSTAIELEEVRKFKNADAVDHDLRLSCEVAPHHLFMCEQDYDRLGNYARMNPPLRGAEDCVALRGGLKDGSIDMVATDHAPHTKEEKEKSYKEAPSGVPGVQTMLPLLLDMVSRRELMIEDIVRLMATRPAEVFKIQGRGDILEGNYADLVVVDMQAERIIRNEDQESKCRWTPFDGRRVTGWPIMTFVNGTLVYKNGKVIDEFVGREVEIG